MEVAVAEEDGRRQRWHQQLAVAKDDGDDDDGYDGVDGKRSDCRITIGTSRIAAMIPIDRTPQDSIVDGDEKDEINDHFEGIGPSRSLQGDLPP
ncbi:hypothetical protein B296_00026661 [Ensete ventricosum]|uniref:Uncharacterized protein n=1 Tax=Ensete ventricosum TaxID=4639 RepID=A0A427A2Y7_ENSVE|nr:hypothetical protein B296_00026661 [Ensete ventricosum]